MNEKMSMKLPSLCLGLALIGCQETAPVVPTPAMNESPSLPYAPLPDALAEPPTRAPATDERPAPPALRARPTPPARPPAPATASAPVREVARTTLRLRGGLHSPLPGGFMAGYAADTGLDIAGFRLPVYAVAAGTLDYSEPGHTAWAGSDDKAVRLALDEPIAYGGRLITHVWYAHLFELAYLQEEGAEQRIHVVAGERLGTSGIANGSPHLHLGFLLDNRIRQHWGTYLLEDEIREVLGGYRAKERLPPEPRSRRRRGGAGASPASSR